MPNCCALNCKNRFVKGSGITFHRFPLRDKTRLKQWILATRRRDFVPNIHTSICSKHFTPDCFYISSGKRVLKEDSVPTEFDLSEHMPKKAKRRRSVVKQETCSRDFKSTRDEDYCHAPVSEEIFIEHISDSPFIIKIVKRECENNEHTKSSKEDKIELEETILPKTFQQESGQTTLSPVEELEEDT